MEILFKSEKLRRNCEDINKAIIEWGPRIARKLIQRLNELSAAECLEHIPHVPPTRRHALQNKRKGQFAVDILHPFRLVFQPISDDGTILINTELSQITRVKILEVVDYHE